MKSTAFFFYTKLNGGISMKAKTKRVVTALLAVVMLLTTLLPLTASAADVTMDLNNCHVSWDYTLTDED